MAERCEFGSRFSKHRLSDTSESKYCDSKTFRELCLKLSKRETNYFIPTHHSLLRDPHENQHINDINFRGEHLKDFKLLSFESCLELARISAIRSTLCKKVPKYISFLADRRPLGGREAIYVTSLNGFLR